MVGSAVVRLVTEGGEHQWCGRTRQELDLRDSKNVYEFLASENPDAVIIAAAKVGGILANKRDPVGFLTENIMIQTNILEACHKLDIESVIFLGSSCIYPKLARQPIAETELLTGMLEETNQSYALAKISGVQLVKSYRSQYGRNWVAVMPTNLYGPNDRFDPEKGHVIPALISRCIEANRSGEGRLSVWGSGNALREFMHVDDLARALLFMLDSRERPELINVGTGEELSIRELASKIASETDFLGSVDFDTSKPEGVSRKLLDSSAIREMGWRPTISLDSGLRSTVEWFKNESRS